ncbi:DUF397 domain-containing protein [Gandjariella thermophila]|uniref:Toxin n=1 Tax=Gandjariella thermophila TaxID=1931992 RepID=A0A4D4JJG6_9PSEU|nr:DUF397 domain-containing protein [Gandjariella thermophila]GDY34053.1 toxin [Gandjariella thermophila]
MVAPTEFQTRWRKSSYSGSNTNCIEIAFGWRKRSYGGDDANCVEVAFGDAVVGIRDSKNPSAGHITVPRDTFQAFLTAINKGTFI